MISPKRFAAWASFVACLSMSNAVTAEEVIPAAAGFALDGMAPAGHWATRLTVLRNSYDTRFDDNGRRVDLDTGYDDLDLTLLNPALAGRLRVDSDVVTEYAELMLGYGINENLTLGAIIPWTRTKTNVRFGVDGGIGTAGMTALLGALGYKPPRSAASSGFSDPTLGLLWRFHKSERDSAVFGFGVRLGIAHADDPDDLFDVPPGDGSNDLRTRLEYFRDLGSGWDMRLLGEYQIQLPDHVTMRPGNPLTTATKERLKRNLGDYWESDIEFGRRFGDWRLSATWHRYQEMADHYTSSIGTDTRYLSSNTDTRADQLRLGLTWSGIDAWRAKHLPLPLIVKLEIQDAVSGRNFVGVRDVYLRVSSFF